MIERMDYRIWRCRRRSSSRIGVAERREMSSGDEDGGVGVGMAEAESVSASRVRRLLLLLPPLGHGYEKLTRPHKSRWSRG
ncbi:hypothetical protein Scep_004242 [Stephania cephalantha]|uniref:Uncharacterized protein n=1 Tax=Stephania cephalantha TaxID=152367 RepID=A0AAP0KTJ9_9MAGN